MTNEKQTDHAKLERLLNAVKLLNKHYLNVYDLTIQLDCSERSVQRYLKLLKTVGFEIEKTKKKKGEKIKYKIVKNPF